MWKRLSAIIPVIIFLFGLNFTAQASTLARPWQPEEARPTLAIPDDITGYINSFVDVPVAFQGNGHAINALTFAVAFDTSILALNPSDVVFSLPAGFSGSAFLQPGAPGILNLSVFSLSTIGLPNGPFVTLPFTATCPTGAGATVAADVGFSANPPATFGSVQGRDVPGSAVNGQVTIDCNGPAPDVNHPPQARDDTAVTDEERSVRVAVLGNDQDVDGDALQIRAITQAAHGRVSTNGSRLTYRPQTNFFGQDIFTYTVSDGRGGVDTATVRVAVRPVNDPPTAQNDATTTDEDTPVSISVLANDSDVDGDALTVASLEQPRRGQVTLTENGVLRYTPPADFSGQVRFRYTVKDGHGGRATARVVVTVNPVNDPPTALDDVGITGIGALVDVDVLANDDDDDDDVDGDALSVTAVADPANGTATVRNNGRVRYTPDVGFTGIDRFTYTVGDGQGGADTASVTLIVQADPAGTSGVVARDDRRRIWEDRSILVAVLNNDSAASGNPLQVLAVTKPANGTVRVEGQAVRYTPHADYYGQDAFSYVVGDGAAGVDGAEVHIAVRPRNDPPDAEDDSVTTQAGQPVDIPVLANDEDVDGDRLRLVAWEQGDEGRVRRQGNGTLRYSPGDGFSGVDHFTYRVADGRGGSATATVWVTVEAVNHPPIAADDTAVTAEDTAVTLPVLDNDSDAEADPLSITDVTQGVLGAVTSDGIQITYTPQADFAGVDDFTYTISDGTSEATATVRVVVSPVPDPPEPQADAYLLNETGERQGERSASADISLDVLQNDVDRDGDALRVLAVGQPDRGTASLNDDGNISYEAPAGFQGTALFTYTVAAVDNSAITGQGRVRVIVPQPGLVTATDDAVETDEDQAMIFDVLANDVHNGGGELNLLGFTPSRFGQVTSQAGGALRYKPNRDFSGEDSFTYIAGDGNLGAAQGVVTITVRAVNDAPQAKPDEAVTDEDQALVISVLLNDADPENDPLTLVRVTEPDNGAVVDNGDGTVTYTPQADYFGADAFAYTVTDGRGGADVAVVRVMVQPVSDPPDPGEDLAFTEEETPVTVDVLTNDFDPDEDGIAVYGFTQPAQGGLIYTPTHDYAGVDTFTYVVSNGVLTATASVELTVDPVNDPPLAQTDVVTVSNSSPITIPVLANDIDVDGDELLIESIATDGLQGQLDWDGEQVVYTPLDGFDGVERFTYVVSDGVFTSTGEVEVRAILAAAAVTFQSQTADGETIQPGQVISYTLDVANTGRLALTGVALRTEIPDNVAVVKVVSSWGGSSQQPRTAGAELVWEMQELGLNQRLHIEFVLRPEATLRGTLTLSATFRSDQIPLLRTQPVHVQIGNPAVGQTGSQIFLPLIARPAKPVGGSVGPTHIYLPHIDQGTVLGTTVGLPDLVVEQLSATAESVQLTLVNRGSGSVTDEFWVDVYVAPTPPPTGVNRVWTDLATEGLVWGVTASALPILPGQAITLTVGDAYYSPQHSTFSGELRPDVPLYAQVDSFNSATSYGAVLEIHEKAGDPYNNITGPLYATGRSSAGPGPNGTVEVRRVAAFSPLPARPAP